MNKNLKKVISAVAALALSVSSFTALAANYPDVPADANYKHAVDELTALKIVEGIEENGVLNFQPDKQVTRAEFSTMVVRALNRENSAKAAAGQSTPFTDVNTSGHWAKGYIATLNGMGIINGYGDGTFLPENNVSYVEAMKMLACAAGYDRTAKQKGGYPQGYLAVANDLGIGDGVSVESNATPLTRAQCAQMIDNAIKAPVLIETGNQSQYGAETEQKSGTGKDYQTILTKQLNAYEVYGRVIATSRTASGDMDPDEVRFQVERAENFEDEYFPRNSTPTDFIAKVGDTNAADQLKVYSEAIIQVDKQTNDYKLICLSPLSENAEVTFAASTFDDENKNYPIVDTTTSDRDYAQTKLYVIPEGTTKAISYNLAKTESGELSSDIKMYINGVESDKDLDQFIEDYIVNNNVGEVTLVSESAVGSTATTGTYNTIMVTSYKDAVVDSVEERGDGYVDIYFIEGEDRVGDASSLTVDKTDDAVDYKITKSGVEIDPADIQPYDVLSIAYDETVNFSESSFYNIIVSDHDIYEGKYSQVKDRDGKKQFLLDGNWEDANNNMQTISAIGNKTDDRYTTYLFYFDNFGLIAYAEETSSDKNIAIIDNLYQSSDKETWYAKLIYKDGTSGAVALGSSYDTDANLAAIENILYEVDNDGKLTDNKKHPSDRVITYRQNSSKELTNVTPITNYSTVENGLYRESTKKLGSFTFSDATSVLVISNAPGGGWDLAALDISTLIDDDSYNAYFYDRSTSGVYSFAMVEDSSGTWSRGTQMAAYVATTTTADENYEYALELLVPGSEDVVDVFLSEDYVGPEEGKPYEDRIYTISELEAGLRDGTPILYTTDASGAITKVMPAMNIMPYSELKDLPYNTGNLADLAGVTAFNNANSGQDETSSDKMYDMVFGLVTMKSGSSVDFVAEITEYTDKDNNVVNVADTAPETTKDHKATDILKTYTMTDDTAVYVYDYNGRASNNTLITKGTQSSVRATSVPKNAWADDNSTKINALYNNLLPRYALARVLGNDIMEIMVFVPENN